MWWKRLYCNYEITCVLYISLVFFNFEVITPITPFDVSPFIILVRPLPGIFGWIDTIKQRRTHWYHIKQAIYHMAIYLIFAWLDKDLYWTTPNGTNYILILIFNDLFRIIFISLFHFIIIDKSWSLLDHKFDFWFFLLQLINLYWVSVKSFYILFLYLC